MNRNPLLMWILYGDNSNEIKRNILEFAGFSVRLTEIGPVKNMSDKKRDALKKKTYQFGKNAQ